MLNNVSVSNFRNDIFNYIDLATKKQKQIGVTKGKKIVGWFVPNTIEKTINRKNMATNILESMDKVRRQINLKTEAKNAEELVNEIDRIVYGVDRNGKELSR